MKILIVDDNEKVASMLEKFLTVKEYDCTVSNDGKDALIVMTREKFDVVLLDLAMPEFSGYDIINELEKSGKIKEQNIVVLTALGITTDQMEALQKQGVKLCLKKPVMPNVLLDVISSMH